MIELTPRLKAIADLSCTNYIPDSICDVGTDHGYIPVYLAKKGCKKAIATDISAPSAQKAADNAVKYKVDDIVSVRVGNGLETVNDNEVETVIIAGMGGLMISRILSSVLPEGIKQFILQPMRSDYELRSFLHNNGFSIKKEVLCEDDGRLYNIMLVTYGKSEYDDFTLHVGEVEKSPLYGKYIIKKRNSLLKKINGLRVGGKVPDSAILELYNRLNDIIEGR